MVALGDIEGGGGGGGGGGGPFVSPFEDGEEVEELLLDFRQGVRMAVSDCASWPVFCSDESAFAADTLLEAVLVADVLSLSSCS